ncbi:hypothetical protein AUI06_11675 [archaeon 13_2_20CM_2_52_21]|nr:MAG: hypothetical protein AUI06_11675 [archaeon 13_2_20CM_2_52_21]
MPVDPVIAVHPDQAPLKLVYQSSLLPPLTTAPIVPDLRNAAAGLFPVLPPAPTQGVPQLDGRSKVLELRWTSLSEPLAKA